MRPNLVHLVTLLSLIGVLLVSDYLDDVIPAGFWSGDYQLIIRVSCASGRPQLVRCRAYYTLPEAEESVLNGVPAEALGAAVTEAPFQGGPLILEITTGGRVSRNLRILSRHQAHYLVALAEMPEGSHKIKLVEIPDGRESKEVTVEFP